MVDSLGVNFKFCPVCGCPLSHAQNISWKKHLSAPSTAAGNNDLAETSGQFQGEIISVCVGTNSVTKNMS